MEEKRHGKLKKLQEKLETPYMMQREENVRDGKRNKRVKSTSSDGSLSSAQRSKSQLKPYQPSVMDSDSEDEKKPQKFVVTKDFKRKPLVKLIKAAENINKGKRKINHNLIRLLDRFDLDRPLMLREKLNIIWKERRSDGILVNNLSSAALLHPVSSQLSLSYLASIQ